MDHGLGRLPSGFDKDDWNLRDFIPVGAPPTQIKEMYWDFPHQSLDQGSKPHCVGFGMAGFGISEPVHDDFTDEDGHRFYYLAKEFDPPEIPLEGGSSVRSAAKALKKMGLINSYAFAPDVSLVKWWLLNRGPMIAGTIWTTDMFKPDDFGIVHPNGDIEGGHCYVLNGMRADDYVGFKNSWGDPWGINGNAFISLVDLEKLFNYSGEVLAAVELDRTTTHAKDCVLLRFYEKWFADQTKK